MVCHPTDGVLLFPGIVLSVYHLECHCAELGEVKVHALRPPVVAPAGCQCGAANWLTNAQQFWVPAAFTKLSMPRALFLLRGVAELYKTGHFS